MEKRKFTKEQAKEMLRNDNVKWCSEKIVACSREFKIKAVKEYNEGSPAREIFMRAGFDLQQIGRNNPRECLKRWNKTYKTKGLNALFEKNKNRRSRKKKNLNKDPTNDKEKVKRLELEIEYLKAENDFLVKLRAKRG